MRVITLKGVFDQRSLLESIFIKNIYIKIISYQSILFSEFLHPYYHIFKP